ncbi:hypothetical protein D3C71_1242080 [compost metagenome]
MTVRSVTKEDCGRLEGKDITPLYSALKKVCPGIEGDALWEKLRKQYNLGVAADCDDWVTRMNKAISVWNAHDPTDCASVRVAYGI